MCCWSTQYKIEAHAQYTHIYLVYSQSLLGVGRSFESKTPANWYISLRGMIYEQEKHNDFWSQMTNAAFIKADESSVIFYDLSRFIISSPMIETQKIFS